MNQAWLKRIGTAMVSLLLAVPLSGCAARPAPRPEARLIDAATNAAVTDTAASVGGTGKVAAVVVGNTALVALQLQAAAPGGTDGGPLIGPTDSGADPQVRGPGSGPAYVQGPGGSTGTTPALPGGGLSPGGSTPGGTPNFEQAVPSGNGHQATRGMADGMLAPVPSAAGAAPLDVMNRTADLIKAKHPKVAEVRFVTDPALAIRLGAIHRDILGGADGEQFRAELQQLTARSIPAGTSVLPHYESPDGMMPYTR